MKLFLLVTVLFVVAAGCSQNTSQAGNTNDSGNDASSEDNEKNSEDELTALKVGASPSPHSEILEEAKDLLKEKGYELEIVEFSDYVLPNEALANGEIDANYFQHFPYLEDYNKENETDLVSAASVHYEPFGLYPGKSSDIEQIKSGGVTIAIPNDTTNEARALLLLEDNGYITLKEGAGLAATPADIEDNPYDISFEELEAAQVSRALADVDFAVINGNYALEAGLTPSGDALLAETSDSLAAETYANIIAVSNGNEDSDSIKALTEVLLSNDIKEYIESTYDGAVVPVF